MTFKIPLIIRPGTNYRITEFDLENRRIKMAHDYDTPGASEPSYIVGTNNLVDPAIGLKTNRHIPRTRLERLKDMKKGLEAKLKEVNDAIEALESNPELTAILKKLEKVNV